MHIALLDKGGVGKFNMAEAVASSRAFCLESKSPVGKISDFI
jgi:hypothetical protein